MKQFLFQEFEEYIQQQNISQGAIMIIGLDNLREINAAYGIKTGDEALKVLSDLIVCSAGAANISRLDGRDEFVILFGESVDAIAGEQIFALLQNQIAKVCRNKSYYFTVSAGMVLFQNIGGQTDVLLACAEYALNRAKEKGKNCLFVYEKEQFLNYMRKMQLQRDLQKSVRNGFEGFELYYQPIISLEKRTMMSAETLLRWRHPKYPKISPAEFIPALEESGLMIEVGHFIIEEAMKQEAAWVKKRSDFVLNINLSHIQFKQSDFVEQIRLLTEKTGADPRHIVFEITESGFIGKEHNVSQQIGKLQDMGFLMALDDFGTGYSNFIYLKELHFNIVKLDRTFITEALAHRNKRELLAHIVETVHSIGMKVCFEGIETAEDFLSLSELAPEYVQGYCFGLPVPAASFEDNFAGFMHQDVLGKISDHRKSDKSMAYLMSEMKEQEDEQKKNKMLIFRLLAFFLPILLIILLVLGVWNYYINRNILKSQLYESMSDSLEISVNTLEARLDETMKLTNDLAVYVKGSYETVGITNYENMLNDLVGSRNHIAGAGIWFERYAYNNQEIVCPYVYRKNGKMILTYYYGGENYNYFEQEYYKKTKERRVAIVTDPYYDSTMGSQIITFASPIISDSGEFIGVTTVDLYVTDVGKTVQGLEPKKNGYAFICGKDNNVLCGYAGVPKAITEKMTGSDGSFEYQLDNSDYEVFYDELKATGWKAAVVFDMQSMYQPIKKVSIIIIVTVLITLLAATGIIVALLAALDRQKRMEFEQKKSLNELHFKALRSSYYVIAVADVTTGKIQIVYESPEAKQAELLADTYEAFVDRLKACTFKDDLGAFGKFVSPSAIKERFALRDFFSQDVRMQLNGQIPEWVELTASRIGEKQNEDSESTEFLFMIRDINEVKSRAILDQEEKQQLISKLMKKNQELFRMSITDNLTGIYNREGLDYYAPEIFEEASHDHKKLFFMIADVNRLKTINDSMGHLKGDEVIKEAAQVISHTGFEGLIAARTGGDEFVLFGAADDSKENFPQLVEASINDGIAASKTSVSTYGISVGYFWGKADGNRRIDYYYNYADKMMYSRKNQIHGA